MQSSIYLTVAIVAFAAAKELNVGPQVFSEVQSSSSSSQAPGKRYVTQEYTLYLTPDELKALQAMKSSENAENTQYPQESQLEQQNDEGKQQLKWYNRQLSSESPQLEFRGLATHDSFAQKQKSDSNNQQDNYYNYLSLYSEEKPKQQTKQLQRFPEISTKNLQNYYNWQKEQENRQDVQTQRESLQTVAKWRPYITEAARNQDDIQLNEQLKQQWYRILDHNRDQLQSVTPAPKESQELKQSEKSAAQFNSNYEIEKEIENILRDQRGYEKVKQSAVGQTEAVDRRLPIIIHKEVSVTKHLPVAVVKKVNVPVPTPVLVPVPEPYEVKIPHPYPVPQQIFKHIPLPVIRKH